MPHPMRRLGVALTLTLTLGLTAGCGDDGTKSDAKAATGSAPGAAFPVTVTSKLGSATLESAPKRIVALGEVDQDALLALGVQPVGMVELTGIESDGLAPWTSPKITGTKPTLLTAGDNGFSIEKVAALRPDLIVAAGDYYIDKEYASLSKLAPTIAYQTGPSEDSWEQITRQVAKAVGKSAEGDKAIAATEAKVASVKTAYPALTGKTFALTSVFPSGNIGVMKSPTDISVKLFSEFGMVLPDKLKTLPGQSFAAELSMEKVSLLDEDVLLSHYNDDAATEKRIEGNALFKNLAVVKRGSYIPLDLKLFWPLRTPTVLSTPYLVDRLVPQIAKAAGK